MPLLNDPLSMKFIPKPSWYQKPFYQGYVFVPCLFFSHFKLLGNWISRIPLCIISIPPSLQLFLLWKTISPFLNLHMVTSNPLLMLLFLERLQWLPAPPSEEVSVLLDLDLKYWSCAHHFPPDSVDMQVLVRFVFSWLDSEFWKDLIHFCIFPGIEEGI